MGFFIKEGKEMKIYDWIRVFLTIVIVVLMWNGAKWALYYLVTGGVIYVEIDTFLRKNKGG